jgi:enediyne biosynthesis protein E4
MKAANVSTLLLPALLFCGCTSEDANPGDDSKPAIAAACEGTFQADSYVAGDTMFREVTQDWGLAGIEAVRVSVLDIDGDALPDLLLRNGGGPDEFAAGGKRARHLLRNQGDRFVDVTEASGLLQPRYPSNNTRNAEVVCSADVDNDGDVDVYMPAEQTTSPSPGSETSELLLNDGSGQFTLGPELSAARGEGMGSAPRGCSFSDIDRNGLVDVFVAHNTVGDLPPLQDRIYLGDGTGQFVDGTAVLGITTETWFPVDAAKLNQALGHSWGWGTAACDLNNDGFPELLAASYGRAPNHLWQAKQDANTRVSFVNRSVDSGYAYDQRSDWTNNINAQCYCADNPGAEDCDSVPAAPDWIDCAALKEAFGGGYRWQHNLDREAWRLGGNSATTTCADINNDGFLDLVTGEIVHWDVGPNSDPAEVALNSGEVDVRLERPGNEMLGLVREQTSKIYDIGDMNNAVFDFDNDGLLDIYISSSDYPGTRGWLFHQQQDGGFAPVPLADGIDHLRSAGAIAVDIDRDGDLDLVVGHSRFRCSGSSTDCYATQNVRVFENLSNGRNHWLELRLEGVSSNRSAIGARVVVEACDRMQTRQVDGGHGHQGAQEDKVLHFGLGQQSRVKVTVHWPDDAQSVETYELDADLVYHLRQGEAAEVLGFNER